MNEPVGFIHAFNQTQKYAHQISLDHGFWPPLSKNGGMAQEEVAMKLCLIHSEVSEALEALRRGDPADDKIPEFSGMEAELADTVIRVMDLAARMDLRLAEAIIAKIGYNATRTYRHGKAF